MFFMQCMAVEKIPAKYPEDCLDSWHEHQMCCFPTQLTRMHYFEFTLNDTSGFTLMFTTYMDVQCEWEDIQLYVVK